MRRITLIYITVFCVFLGSSLAIAGDFYVIAGNRLITSWDKKIPGASRFKLVLDGEAVLDKETGLVWAKNARLSGGTKSWMDAIWYCHDLTLGSRKGWRLPTVAELSSLVDPTRTFPSLPDDHPFVNTRSSQYWSSTSAETDSDYAWYVWMDSGRVQPQIKTQHYYIWPVRGGP